MANFKQLSFLLVLINIIISGSSINPQHYTLHRSTITQFIAHEQQIIPKAGGGYTSVPIEQSNKAIDNYIKAQIPQLSAATLVHVQTQVVNGVNYSYTYQIGNNYYSVLVWDNDTAKERQIKALTKVSTSKNQAGQTVKKTSVVKFSNQGLLEAANNLPSV